MLKRTSKVFSFQILLHKYLVINKINISLGNWSISWLWCLVGDGNTLVPDISNVARVSIIDTVGNNLGATIRKGNTVFSSSVVSIAVFVVGILGSSVVLITLDSVSELISWGINWLGLSINWGGPVGGSRDNNWGWGRDNNWLLTDDGSNGGRGKNWSREGNWGRSKKDWSTDEGKRSGTRNNSDKRRGSNTDNGSGSSNKDWAMSVSMCVRVISVGNDGGHQAGENDESLKKVEFN